MYIWESIMYTCYNKSPFSGVFAKTCKAVGFHVIRYNIILDNTQSMPYTVYCTTVQITDNMEYKHANH